MHDNWPERKYIQNTPSRNTLSLFLAQNKDLGAASQTLLTKVKLRQQCARLTKTLLLKFDVNEVNKFSYTRLGFHSHDQGSACITVWFFISLAFIQIIGFWSISIV